MPINYRTKFKIGERVRILRGSYRDRTGVVTDYTSGQCHGRTLDDMNRNIEDGSGTYDVKISFINTVSCLEGDLESIDGSL